MAAQSAKCLNKNRFLQKDPTFLLKQKKERNFILQKAES